MCECGIRGHTHFFIDLQSENIKQEGQEALNRSTEFCLKLTYRYLLKAGHVPGDT